MGRALARVLLLAWFAACATPSRPGVPPPAPPAGSEPAAVEEASSTTPATPVAAPAPRPPLRQATAMPPGVRTSARARIAAVGDVLMHGAVKDAAADHRAAANDDGYGWLWSPVADLLADADLTFANLETPVAPRSGEATRSFVFNAGPAVVTALRRAGVDVVSIANNHVFDQGRAGFDETLSQLDALGMAYVGAGPAGREAGPRIFETGGLRVAFLGYSRFFNQSGNDDCGSGSARGSACIRAAVLEADRAVADVRAAAASADAVVVSLHWGEEYQAQPREADVALAHRLADAGALIVLGHHPHVLQPLELYGRPDGTTSLIAYSLGNFVSNQSRFYVHGVTPAAVGATRDGALVRAEIVRREYGRGVSRVELAGVGWIPLWTENDTADPIRRASRRRPAIRVVAIDRALSAARAELARMPEPVPPTLEGRYVELRRKEELLAGRRAAIAAVLGEDLELEPPPARAGDAGTATLTPAAASP